MNGKYHLYSVCTNDFIHHFMQWQIKSFVRINIEFIQMLIYTYRVIYAFSALLFQYLSHTDGCDVFVAPFITNDVKMTMFFTEVRSDGLASQ